MSSKLLPSSSIPVPAGNFMGVVRDVNPDEIRRAYHQLAGQYRSDAGKAPDADSGFKEPGGMSGE